MDDPELNPYAAPNAAPAKIVIEGAINAHSGKLRLAVAMLLAIAILVGAPIASSYAVDDIESIIVSGAILLSVAIILAAVAYRTDLRPLTWISLAMITIILGCFLVIFGI